MANIFEVEAGKVAVLRLPGGRAPFALSIEGLFDSDRSPDTLILTEFAYSRNVGIQMVPALNETVYSYIFAERPSSFRASGILLPRPCESDGDSLATLFDYFDKYNAATNEVPVSIVLGVSAAARTIRGFLSGVRVDVSRPEQMNGQFALDFRTLPVRQ